MKMRLNSPIQFARAFAEALHADAGQTYGDFPYSKHLDDVYSVLRRHGFTDTNLLAAAYLHDVMEDVGIIQETIEDLFSYEVGHLVWAVTDVPGPNRSARKAATYPKIRIAGRLAIALKLADRIANVENAIETKNPILKMYRKEQKGFETQLRSAADLEDMWEHLNRILV